MTDFTAYLRLGVDSRDALQAQKDLDKMAVSGVKADKSFSLLAAGSKILGAALGAMGAGKVAGDLISITRETGIMTASLRTATGSAESAAVAFDAITKLASQLPESVDSVSTAFTKLVNYGLNPSEAAIKSYANTAAALGKDLSQMVEAVADAATGEFERLKEFGIKSKVQGDQVSFVFRGVTKTVQNSAEEIESYLQSIGDVEFAGSATEQMKELDGEVSNLADSYDGLLRSISKAGAGDLISAGVRSASSALQELNDQVASGQLGAYLDATAGKFSNFADSARIAFEMVAVYYDDFESLFDGGGGFLLESFKNLPENLTAFIQIATIEVASFADKVSAYGEQIARGLNPVTAIKDAVGGYEQLNTSLGIINQTRLESIEASLSERDAALASFDSQISKADELRQKYDENAAAVLASGDALAQFQIKGEKAADAISSSEKKRAASVAASIAELEKQNALFNNQSKYADILYDIEAGLLKVTDAEKARYLAAAQTSDQLEANKNLAASMETFAKKSEEDKAALDEWVESIDEFGGAWTRTGSVVADALGGITDALDDYSAKMAYISAEEKKAAANRIKFASDPAELKKISAAEKKLAEERTSANLKSFSTITSAFGQMFDEQSKERQAINNAEKVFTAIEIGLALQKASANALTAITASFAAPFPVNFAAGAAMIAIMAGLGVFGGGGGSSGAPTAADIQEAQGTGTVLGSSDKSESIAASAEEYKEIGLEQLSELRGIRDALTGLSSGIALLARDFISGGNFSGAEVKGLGNTQALSVGDFAGKEVYDFLNPLGADILNRGLKDLFGSTKKSLKDSGLKLDDQELGDILAGNFEAYFYNTVETTKKKLFGLSKRTSTKDELTGVDSAFEDQIAGIFGFIGSAVGGSLDALGIESSSAIENFKISIGKVSFKDLSGEEIQSELEAIFSQQADLLAEYAAPALKEYQQIGEGLFETLARVASEFVTFNSYVDALGLNFNATGLDAIAAQQAIAGFSGGMETLSENLSSYYENFFTEEERAANQMKLLTAEMNTLGYDAVPTSREAFRSLVEGIDLTTEAGQKQFAGLVALNEVFADLVPETEALVAASRSAADIAKERTDLEQRLWQMTATVADVREKELAALDGTNKSILDQIYALQDLQAAEKEAAAARVAVTNQLASLEKQYFDLTATEAEKRNALLQSLLSDEARAIQENIYAWNDAQTAAAEANKALEEAASEAAKALEDAAYAMDALKSAASSAFDVLLSSVDAERARIESIVSNASSAKSALDSAIDAERSAIDKANQGKIAQLQSLADAERSAAQSNADAQNEAQKALSQARISSINDEKSAVNERIGGLKSLFEQLTSAAADVAPKTNASILAARRLAEFEIDTALSNAAAGRGLPTDGRLDTALQSIKENPSELYANAAQMRQANAVLQNKLGELAGYTERQLTSEEQTLSILEQQLAAAQVSSDSFVEYAAASTNKYDDMIAAANAQYANDVAGLDLIAKNAQAQIDKLTGIDSATLSVEEALTAFNESLLAADFENAQEQYARLDGLLDQGQLQLNTLLDIDTGVLSLRDAIDRFAAAVGAADQTKVNEELLAEMKRTADELNQLREEQRIQALAQQTKLNETARNTLILTIPEEA